MIKLIGDVFVVVNGTPEEIADLDAKLKRVSPDELRWHAPGRRGEMQVRYNEVTRRMWLPRPDKNLEDKLDAQYERVPGQLQWYVKEDGFTVGRAVDMLKAKVSGKLDPADPIVVQRLKSCLGPPKCTALKTDQDGSWCGACGCGKVFLAKPDGSPGPKVLYKTLKCPRMMPGFSNAS